jgi:hypothetical protein
MPRQGARLSLLLVATAHGATSTLVEEWRASNVDATLTDAFVFWSAYRDDLNGLYCDSLSSGNVTACGAGNDFYSSAGTGMGMVMECIFAELGLITRGTAQDRVAQTLATVKDRWPSEPHAGFYAHFSNRQYAIVGEVSTVDSAELVMGALFAANYFANATLSATAQLLLTRTNWSYALAGAAEPTIYPVINATSGERSGRILPFNEYFIIAYIAQLAAPSPGSVASQYYATYMQGPPTGCAHETERTRKRLASC